MRSPSDALPHTARLKYPFKGHPAWPMSYLFHSPWARMRRIYYSLNVGRRAGCWYTVCIYVYVSIIYIVTTLPLGCYIAQRVADVGMDSDSEALSVQSARTRHMSA